MTPKSDGSSDSASAVSSEAQIAVHWREEEYVKPPRELRRTGERGGPRNP